MAHLWFVTIHSFEDGNGRIARAIADMALARSEQSSQRFYSMSAQIRQERADYYDIPERTQKATMDITPWMDWFWDAWGVLSKEHKLPSEPCSPKRTFGRPLGSPC
jgi:Fic family protein